MPTAISLYTGVGGLDFGFEAAGFETRIAVELDAVCCAALAENRPNWPVLRGDIHAFTSEQILDAADLEVREADVLIGGPPCQPFSKAGFWVSGETKRLSDPRSSTLEQYLRVLHDSRPRAFLLENVPGLAFSAKREGLRLLLDGINEINRSAGTSYSPSVAKLNAAHYGVPQMRERVFLVGARDGTPFRFPAPSHAEGDEVDLLSQGLEPLRTAWDALGDLPQDLGDPALAMRGKWAALLPTIPEGENYLWHTCRGGGARIFGWRTRFWSFLLKLAKNRPAWTIQAQPGPAVGPFHWQSRHLSPQELCRIQSFPDALRFNARQREVQRMLGNAVPSLLAEVLAREIRAQLLDGVDGLARTPTLLRPRREGMPPPEVPAPLPEHYRRLIGEHEDHPGTGLGPGARRRVDAV
ncbi:DNA cytosine methyltransferase [Thiorhodococcus mannitoliphagus]|uniref:Cytosine-specific methyltransferase n=1 Tax=Thiorhodococcus mannitoliphagus TaxID=329406 RepID=A0A6P1E6S1_9GAMM|nr:DNA cytosine methyltransferase [Thiorhodococcus mannitoliphagus]NEX23255.1 DNA cytosine methyltransferase [Thiorhodococcus mannitoliphagus]